MESTDRAAEFMNERNFAAIGGAAERLRPCGLRARHSYLPTFLNQTTPDITTSRSSVVQTVPQRQLI
jgi:hypothetical protein